MVDRILTLPKKAATIALVMMEFRSVRIGQLGSFGFRAFLLSGRDLVIT